MVDIYFEGSTTEKIATFKYHEDYIELLPTLQLMAKERGYDHVSESLKYEEEDSE